MARTETHEDQEVIDLAPELRRVLGARLHDPELVDDLVQEVLVRVLAARSRLGERALAPYAVVTARNLVASLGREQLRHRRHAHRLVDPAVPEDPEQVSLRREDERAVASALERLNHGERSILISHEVMGVDTKTIASEHDSTPGAVAVRLARLRARLRVDYLLALRKDEPPTTTCRPILIAMSAGDKRRQTALGAGEHLMMCPFCAELSEPVLSRRRSAAALIPIGLGAKVSGLLSRFIRSPKGQATTGVVVAGAVGVAALALTGDEPSPRFPATGPVMAEGQPVFPLKGDGEVARYAGDRVRATKVEVESVPADEGFWIGTEEGDRIFVLLTSRGESHPSVRSGDVVSFGGAMVEHGPSFPQRIGVRASEGAAQLSRQGAHVSVPLDNLRVD